MQKVLTANIYQLSQFYSQFISRRGSKIYVAFVFKENPRVIVTIKLKKCVTPIGIVRVILGKLCY